MPKNKKQKPIKIPPKMLGDVNDLVLERIFKNTYLSLGDEERQTAVALFSSKDKKGQDDFVRRYMPNLKDIFKKEVEKIAEELQEGISNMAKSG